MVNFQSIDNEMLERICNNAKLNLTDLEKRKFISELGDILAAFKTLEEIDTKGISPAYHATEVKNVWREDTAKRKKTDIKKNTKAIEDGYIIGPKLI